MRKIIVILVLFLSLSASVNAQVKLGVKGGLNVSSLKLNDQMFAADNKAGFFFGPMLKVTVPLIGLSFDAAALYDQKEATVRTSDEAVGGTYNSTNLKQKFIDIPVNVRYGIGLSKLANVFVFAGPQWGINVGNKDFKWNDTHSYSLKKANFSVNVGAGVTLLNHLQASVNYNIETSKTGRLESDASGVNTNSVNLKSRNNTWQVSVGYWF